MKRPWTDRRQHPRRRWRPFFIAVQINHPELTLEFVGSREFLIRESCKMLMAGLAVVGVLGLDRLARPPDRGPRCRGCRHLRHRVPGHAHRVLIAAFVPPAIGDLPDYVRDVLTAASSAVGRRPTSWACSCCSPVGGRPGSGVCSSALRCSAPGRWPDGRAPCWRWPRPPATAALPRCPPRPAVRDLLAGDRPGRHRLVGLAGRRCASGPASGRCRDGGRPMMPAAIVTGRSSTVDRGSPRVVVIASLLVAVVVVLVAARLVAGRSPPGSGRVRWPGR